MSAIEWLPPQLAERAWTVANRAVGDGKFVLYWMHHAVRDHG